MTKEAAGIPQLGFPTESYRVSGSGTLRRSHDYLKASLLCYLMLCFMGRDGSSQPPRWPRNS
jgi:hypothetical protein